MRIIKQHDTTYNSLHHCLEAHFGTKHRSSGPSPGKYREAEQGLRNVPFQSRYPLQLDYMTRRKKESLVQTAFGFIHLKLNSGK